MQLNTEIILGIIGLCVAISFPFFMHNRQIKVHGKEVRVMERYMGIFIIAFTCVWYAYGKFLLELYVISGGVFFALSLIGFIPQHWLGRPSKFKAVVNGVFGGFLISIPFVWWM